MTELPTLIDVTTSSALVEFKQANGTTHYYQVEFAQITRSHAEQYVKGVRINAVYGQSTYRISQTGLIPGRRYHFRIIPIVRVRTYYAGIPSGVVEVNVLVPGKVQS